MHTSINEQYAGFHITEEFSDETKVKITAAIDVKVLEMLNGRSIASVSDDTLTGYRNAACAEIMEGVSETFEAAIVAKLGKTFIADQFTIYFP